MSLYNEMASRFGCDRVSLGILKGRYVRVAALSHTEKFGKGMELVQTIEAAMEECLDQDAEIVFPVAPGSSFITRAASELSKRFGGHRIVGIPVRDVEKQAAVITMERSSPIPPNPADICDQIIRLTGSKTSTAYPERLRRVKYRDQETGVVYEFLTNNFVLPAVVIARLYKQHWQVELFFKWIKKHLHIKTFFGLSGNAVRIQVWTALSAYLLLTIVKKRLALPQDLHEMTQTLRLHLFAKMPILSMFFEPVPQICMPFQDKQLALFE